LMVILEDHGVDMTYKWKNGSADVIEGVRFSMDGYTFPGSKIDRQLSYGNLLKHFAKQEQQQEAELRQNPQDIGISNEIEPQQHSQSITSDIAHGRKNEAVDDSEELKKRKKKKPLVYRMS